MKQFKLTDEGVILFQPDPTNPLPGKPVGKIRKGDSLLRPAAEPEGDVFGQAQLTGHLHNYIDEILQPLAALQDEEKIQEPARNITDKLHGALGILPRAELEEPIAGLDEGGRSALRARKVRLGPVLVFLPLLNKPAAVRLRALLWNLWHDKALPAHVPPDGVTSIAVGAGEDIDSAYYRSIGYPVYGPRAIRVDMLDRLICEIYDSAEKGKFQAQHKMAEWLGCPISDLYEVLEAMGHKKIYDPADEQKDEQKDAEDKKPENAAAEAESEDTGKAEKADTAEKTGQAKEVPGPATAEDSPAPEPAKEVAKEVIREDKSPEDSKAEKDADSKDAGQDAAQMAAKSENKDAAAAEQERPELATFRLRKGRAYGKPPAQNKSFKDKGGDFKGGDFKRKPKPHNQKRKPHKKQGPPKERVITAAAPKKNEENSPFSVLKDLKVQNKD